jgi:hypothetical protein
VGSLTVQQSTRQRRWEAWLVSHLSLFDLTGALVYMLMRRLLAVRKRQGSATDTFQDAARLITQAHNEAVGPSEWTEGRYALARDHSTGGRRV